MMYYTNRKFSLAQLLYPFAGRKHTGGTIYEEKPFHKPVAVRMHGDVSVRGLDGSRRC